jgi:uncharacterized protein
MTIRPLFRSRRVAAVLAASALVLAACGGSDEPAAPAPAPAPAPDAPAADAEVCDTIPEFITIGTGGTGGVYYPLGGAVGDLLGRTIDGVRGATAEVTGGSVANLNLIHAGEAEIGLAQGDAVVNGYNGLEPFEGPRDFLTIGLAYVNFAQWVSYEGSRVQSWDDIPGSRFSTGDAGSATNTFTLNVLAALGISVDDFTEQRLPFADQTTAMINKQLDAGSWVVGLGASSILELANAEQIVFLDFTDAQVAQIVAAHPYYAPAIIPAGTYPGQDEDVQSIGTWNSWVVAADASECFVYEVTKALYENVETVGAAVPAGNLLSTDNLQFKLTPLHPGAIKYFEEIGIDASVLN